MENKNIKNKVVTRFAPSSTGLLHFGGCRTALYNYIFAKQNGGEFHLRIEDTDQKRYVPKSEDYIINSLKALGIMPDKGIDQSWSDTSSQSTYANYRQSEQTHYQKYVDQLLSEGKAYYAFDTSEELDVIRKRYSAMHKVFSYSHSTRMSMKNSLSLSADEVERLLKEVPYVIRFKVPSGVDVVFEDLIRGNIKISSDTLDDKVLFKSDGLPAYHLANIVDDHIIGTTHVIRGEEWISSCPLHILLHEALGFEVPTYAHLPLILKPDGKGKLSKRDAIDLGIPIGMFDWADSDKRTYIKGLTELEYEPEAVLNMLAFLGWTGKNGQEVYSIDEMIRDFDLKDVHKNGARFSMDKLRWFNKQWLDKLSNDEYLERLKNSISKHIGIDVNLYDPKVIESLVALRKDYFFVEDLVKENDHFLTEPVKLNSEVDFGKMVSNIGEDNIKNFIILFVGHINKNTLLDDAQAYLDMYSSTCKEIENFKAGPFKAVLRVLLTHKTRGLDIFETMFMLGKSATCHRLENNFVKYLNK